MELDNMFIDDFSQIEAVARALAEFNEYWKDSSISRTVLFAEIGKTVSTELLAIDENVLTRVLNRAEQCLRLGDDSLKNDVTTGFLEALWSPKINSEAQKRLLQLLGEQSRRYIVEWTHSFQGQLPRQRDCPPDC
jgi:hypothetical protein